MVTLGGLFSFAVAVFFFFQRYYCAEPTHPSTGEVTASAIKSRKKLATFLGKGITGRYARMLYWLVRTLDWIFTGRKRRIIRSSKFKFYLGGGSPTLLLPRSFSFVAGFAIYYSLVSLIFSFTIHQSFVNVTSLDLQLRFSGFVPNLIIVIVFASWPLAAFLLQFLFHSKNRFTRNSWLMAAGLAMIPAILVAVFAAKGVELQLALAGTMTWLIIMISIGTARDSNAIGTRIAAVSASLFWVAALGAGLALFVEDELFKVLFYIFYFGIPLANALPDWISWCFSRLFMDRVLENILLRGNKTKAVLEDIFYIALDLIIGIVLLSFTLWLVQFVILQASIAAPGVEINFSVFFGRVLTDPYGMGLPLVVMISTTLLPTVLHIGIAVLSVALVPIQIVHASYAKQLQYDGPLDLDHKFWIPFYLTFAFAFSCFVIFLGVYTLTLTLGLVMDFLLNHWPIDWVNEVDI